MAVVRPIDYNDIASAIELLKGGSLTPEFEDGTKVDDYWSAVEETRRRRGDVLVAEVNGEVVGVCQILIFQHFQHAGAWCCELESVHVRSDRRGHGVGTKLLAEAEVFARRAGCYRMQLTSRNVRIDAHRFYETNGFEQTSQGFKKAL